MRIIKYLFLLFLLSLVAITIYIATQKGNFTVESNKLINSPKTTVFDYVNNYSNWQKFSTWIANDRTMKLSFSPTTTGNGSSLTWEGNNDIGNIQTLYTKGNDSIVQKMEFNGTSSDVFWSFKDTVGGTKVTWKSVGKMDFIMKINTFFNGGTKNTLSKIFDKCLVNIDKTLDFENSTFDVKVNGIVYKLETFYLRQSFTSKISDVTRNANVVFPKITTFCKQNNLVLNGKPFIIYHTYDTINNLSKVSFCIPIKEQIFTSQGSDILSGKLVAFEALKTSLTGSYDFKNKAIEKTNEYKKANNIRTGSTFSHLEIFTIGKNETLSPSKWKTDLYFPITPKNFPQPATPKAFKRVVIDSTAHTPVPAIKTSPVAKPAITKPAATKTPVTKVPAIKTPAENNAPENKKTQDEFEF